VLGWIKRIQDALPCNDLVARLGPSRLTRESSERNRACLP